MNTKVLERVSSSLASDTSIALTQNMVRIDSTNGKEDALACDLEARLKSLRVGQVWCEKTYEGRLNTLWEVDSGKPGPSLLFTGHLDTKPVCEGWQRDPFDGAIENGRIYGHGVMDMKAGLGSLIGGIMTLVESGSIFSGKITFCAVADHMGQQTGSIDLFRRHQFDHCVSRRTDRHEIYIAHRGRYYFDISTIGRSAHTCHKYHAINAIEKMLPVVEEISKLKYMPDIPQAMKELVGPELYTAVGRIYGGLFPGGPSMIPDRCTIRVDTRPQPGVPHRGGQSDHSGSDRSGQARDPEISNRDGRRRHQELVHGRSQCADCGRAQVGLGDNDRQAGEISWRLLARRYGKLRAIVRDRDLRSRWRAGLSAERIACAYRHRGCDAHLRADGGQHSSRGLSEAPIRDNDMAYMELRADEYVSLPARKLGEMVMDRRVSPVHLMELALASAKAAEPRINAYVSFLEPWAREIACEREQEARDGRMRSALHGVPIAVKDNFYLAGFPLARGSRTDPAYVPDATAPMVERLLDAGAVVIGKTTTPEFGWKGTGISPLTGVTRNPWNPERNSGGSSAGSAATVAAGAVAVSIGTDAGGSIRIPASFCGVPGFKPTLGRIPVWPGTVTEALSHAGPFGRFVDDISLTFALTEGPDSLDPMSYAATGPGDDARRQRLRAGTLRVGIIPAPFDIAPIQPSRTASPRQWPRSPARCALSFPMPQSIRRCHATYSRHSGSRGEASATASCSRSTARLWTPGLCGSAR